MSASNAHDAGSASCSATIGRFDAERSRWRVVVEATLDQERYQGRLIFQRDDPGTMESRVSAPMLTGRTPEEVVSAAHELPEKRVRAVLHSLL
jgi:hypothetical protein